MSANCEQGITLAGDLHARPAGALAVAAGRFAAAVSVTAGGQTADAKSVLGVMGLGATSGQHVTVSAAGPDAQEAVAVLITILGKATKVGGLTAQLCWPRHAIVDERGVAGLPDAELLEVERLREPVEEPLAGAEHHGRDDDSQLVDVPGGQRLADEVRAAHHVDLLVAGRGPGPLDRLGEAAGEGELAAVRRSRL